VAGFERLVEHGIELARQAMHDDRVVGLGLAQAQGGPFLGRLLRVEVDDGGDAIGGSGSDGEVQDDGALARAPLLADCRPNAHR
jgi:hypothetical protein